MKKILLFLLIVMIAPLLLNNVCHASDYTSTELANRIEELYNEHFAVDEEVAEHFNNLADYLMEDENRNLLIYSNEYYGMITRSLTAGIVNTYDTTSFSINGASWDVNYQVAYGTWNEGDHYNLNYTGRINVVDYGTADEIMQGEIDWDTIYYNPQIPVPKLDIWYLLTLDSYLEDYDAVVNANIDVPDSTDFFIELAWKWSVPEQIRVYPSDIKGTPAYDYGYYSSSDLKTIYSLQDMKNSINVHVKGEDLKQEWQNFYDDYYDTITFYTTDNASPNNWLANARLKYIKKMGTQLPMYGNRLEVFARYWTLSEDNKVVVGKWYHWQSARGSATEDPPENYVNYEALPGYSGTVENVPTGSENTYNGVGEETGKPNTTVIQYAPNYPDYPTVASYNKDNLLVSSIQKLNEVKVFFGEFNDFLAVSFVWIPSWIWAIIGAGFALSIVVFFLRML